MAEKNNADIKPDPTPDELAVLLQDPVFVDPTSEELAVLLQDPVFVDYFNVFLSLPIFAQRLLYRFDDKDFEYDPPLKRRGQVLNRQKLIGWLLRMRVPYFLRSDLYLDYLLAKELVDTKLHLSQSAHLLDYDEVETFKDREQLMLHMGNVLGMRKFQQHLLGTSGAILLQFWKDAKQFGRHAPGGDRQYNKERFRLMQIKYFGSDSFIWDDPLVWRALTDSDSVITALESVKGWRADDDHDWPRHSFQHLHHVTQQTLRQYWLPRYMLHCRAGDAKLSLQEDLHKIRSVSDLEALRQLRDIDQILALAQGNLKPHKKTQHQKSTVTWNAMFPSYNIDETFLMSSDDVVTLHADGRLVLDSLSSPQLKEELDNLNTSCDNERGHAAWSQDKMQSDNPKIQLITSSRVECQTAGHVDLAEAIRQAEAKRRTRELPRPGCRLLPLADNAGGTAKAEHRRPRTSLPAQQPVLPALPQKVQSAKLTRTSSQMKGFDTLPPIRQRDGRGDQDIPQQGLPVGTSLSFESRNAQQRKYVSVWRVLMADFCAGGPMLTYLQGKDAMAARLLTFWQKWQTSRSLAQTPAAQSRAVADHAHFQHVRILILRHLLPHSEEHISLPAGMAEALTQTVQDNADLGVIQEVEDHVVKTLLPHVDAYRRWDKDNFLHTVVSRKAAIPNSFQSVQMPTCAEPLDQVSAWTYSHGQVPTQDMEDDWPRLHAEEDFLSESEGRQRRALQLAMDLRGIDPAYLNLDDPTVDKLPFEVETQHGSLALRKLTVVSRSDLVAEREFQRRARLAARAARLAELEAERPSEEETAVDIDDTPQFARPFYRKGGLICRPSKPRSFSELLRIPLQVEFFQRFLNFHAQATPIQFWLAVEELKSKDPHSLQHSITRILRKYFMDEKRYEELDTSADVIQEIRRLDSVSLAVMVSAQSCIVQYMERKWWITYSMTYPCDLSNEPDRPDSREGVIREKPKELWMKFARQVVRFKETIMDSKRSRQFSDYLQKETAKEVERQRQVGNAFGLGVPIRKIVKSKVIDMSKLTNDLSFLAEGERFRAMCDHAEEAAQEGVYRPEDQLLLNQKARVLGKCYLSSAMPPKLQINISQSVCDEILDNITNGVIDRGLFHDASMILFGVMIHLRAKFQNERVATFFCDGRSKDGGAGRSSAVSIAKPTTPNFMDMDMANMKKIKSFNGRVFKQSEDESTRLIFNLEHGMCRVMPQRKARNQESLMSQNGEVTHTSNSHGFPTSCRSSVPSRASSDDDGVLPSSLDSHLPDLGTRDIESKNSRNLANVSSVMPGHISGKSMSKQKIGSSSSSVYKMTSRSSKRNLGIHERRDNGPPETNDKAGKKIQVEKSKTYAKNATLKQKAVLNAHLLTVRRFSIANQTM